jgi:hypothetical protein
MRRWWMVLVLATSMAGAAHAQDGGALKFGSGTAGAHFGVEFYLPDTPLIPLGFAFDANAVTLGFDLEARGLLPLIYSDALFVYVYGGGGVRTEDLFGRFGFTTTLGATMLFQPLGIGIYIEVEPANYLIGGSVRLFSRWNLGLALGIF